MEENHVKHDPMAMIAIVAIVAIVALFLLFFKSSTTSSSSTDDLAGQAIKVASAKEQGCISNQDDGLVYYCAGNSCEKVDSCPAGVTQVTISGNTEKWSYNDYWDCIHNLGGGFWGCLYYVGHY